MREAPVGWQCASCVKKDSRTAPVTRWRPGAAPSARISPVVAVIVAACVVVYLWQQGHPGFEFKYGLSPFSLHYGHRWYEAITSAFLHASPLHILLNMMTLVIVGPTLERALGSVRFAAVYLISALGGSVGYYLLAPANSLAVGASGAIFGLLGAWFVAARLRGWPAQPMTGLLVINLLFSFTVSGIAWQAHIGGLVAGALAALGMEFTGRTRPTPTARVIQSVLTFVVLTGVMVVLLALPPGHVNVGS
jgi:membrane associated rhomboid family serine protease